MMRTMAPRDLGGRLCLNCARTTPELPVGDLSAMLLMCLPLCDPRFLISPSFISSSSVWCAKTYREAW